MQKLTYQEILETKPSVDEVKEKDRTPICLVLDNVRSLHNVGAIFRTCDAVLVEKVYLCGITGHPPRKEISKTALGAEEVVPWEYRDNAVDVIKELKKEGRHIVGVELAKDAEHYAKFDYQAPLCLVLGHEVEGISDEVMQELDSAIYLPMLGRANSLNVATCCGIVLYQALNQI